VWLSVQTGSAWPVGPACVNGTAVITLPAASGGLVTRGSYTSSPDLVGGSAAVSQGLEHCGGVVRMHPQLGPAVLGQEGDRLLVHRHHR
jgi:hypothetical protein